jgi:hypothetical protein
MSVRVFIAFTVVAAIAWLGTFVPDRAQSAGAQIQSEPSSASSPTTSPFIATTSASPTVEGSNIELMVHIGGPASAIAVQGDYAYAGFGPELAILDITDPQAPTRVGYVVLPDFVQDVTVDGGYAYVAAGEAGLRVVDVSDPSAPAEAGFAGGGWSKSARGVAVAGDYAYIACGIFNFAVHKGHLLVVDISDPANPAEVGFSEKLWQEPALDVAVMGSYAYVVGSRSVTNSPPNGGLWILDISNPAAPSKVGSYDSPGFANSVAVAGGYAYVVAEGAGLRVVRIKQPASPTEVGSYKALGLGHISDLTLAGNHAYVATGEAGFLRVLDISNPAMPAEIGSYDPQSNVNGVVVVGERAYVTAEGLQVLDVSDATDISAIGTYETLEYIDDMAVSNGYAYVASTAFRVFDISNPADPIQVGRRELSFTVSDLAEAEGYAYVAGGDTGLHVLDVSNPITLTEISVYDPQTSVRGVALAGHYAYVATSAGLSVLDISNPITPTEVGFHDTAGQFLDKVAEADGYVYATYRSGLRVIDVSSPTAPAEVGVYPIDVYPLGRPYDVVTTGRYAYTFWQSCWSWDSCDSAVDIIDIQDPTHPAKVGLYSASADGVIAAITASDRYLCAAHTVTGLCIVDVSQPTAPAALECHLTPGGDEEVVAADGIIYVAGRGGLFVLQEGFSISGRVADLVDRPFSGVTISSHTGQTAVTDETGTYRISDLSLGTYTITPTLGGHTFWPPTRTVKPGPDTRSHDFVILPGPVSITLTPGTGSPPASLVYTDTQGLPTRLDFITGTVTQTTILTLTPTIAGSLPGFAFAKHAFDLAAFHDSEPVPGLTFGAPVTITISYSDRDVRLVLDESQLALWRWTDGAWRDAAQTCDPAPSYTRDEVNNLVSVPVCRTGLFGLFGPTHQIYMPIIMRSP